MARQRKDEITEAELAELLAEAGKDTTTSPVTSITVEEIEDDLSPLTDTEEKERKRLERKVEKAFYEAGSALRELRDRRLYRNTHTSFEEYCRAPFGDSRSERVSVTAVKNLITSSRVLKFIELCQRIVVKFYPPQNTKSVPCLF